MYRVIHVVLLHHCTADLTLIWMIYLQTQLLCRFWQIPLIQSKIEQVTENPSQPNPGDRPDESTCTETGLEAIEGLRFLASFPLPSTGKSKGGKKTQPFNRFASHPVMYKFK